MIENKTIIITGGAGFIGSKIINKSQLLSLAEPLIKNQYGKYLKARASE